MARISRELFVEKIIIRTIVYTLFVPVTLSYKDCATEQEPVIGEKFVMAG
jgi:hypothetical protein